MARRFDRLRRVRVLPEDPRETLDYFYQTELEELQLVRRAVQQQSDARKRVELQLNQLQQSLDKLEGHKSDATKVGRPDLAEEAQGRITAITEDIARLQKHYVSAAKNAEQIVSEAQRQTNRLDSFRALKEIFKVEYTSLQHVTRPFDSAYAE